LQGRIGMKLELGEVNFWFLNHWWSSCPTIIDKGLWALTHHCLHHNLCQTRLVLQHRQASWNPNFRCTTHLFCISCKEAPKLFLFNTNARLSGDAPNEIVIHSIPKTWAKEADHPFKDPCIWKLTTLPVFLWNDFVNYKPKVDDLKDMWMESFEANEQNVDNKTNNDINNVSLLLPINWSTMKHQLCIKLHKDHI